MCRYCTPQTIEGYQCRSCIDIAYSDNTLLVNKCTACVQCPRCRCQLYEIIDIKPKVKGQETKIENE